MKLITFILILTMGFGYCESANSQTYSILISDKIIEGFFKGLSPSLPHPIIKLNREILEWNERDLYGEQDTLFQIGDLTKGIMEIDSVKFYFTSKDLKYVEKQYMNLEDDHWYAADFRKYEVLDTIGMRKILSHSYSQKKMGKNYAYTFSVPLFSLNQEYAIVQQEFYCGIECSTYCIYIYKRSTDKKSWTKKASWKCISAGTKKE